MTSLFSFGAFRSIACAVAVASFAVSAQAAITFTDGAFSNWDVQPVNTNATTLLTIGAQSTSGNPGAYLASRYELNQSSTAFDAIYTRTAAFNPLFVWRPAVDGALAAMDFSMDMRTISAVGINCGTGCTYVRAAIKQGDKIFTVGSSDVLAPFAQWFRQDWHFDSASNWLPFIGTDKPDFSTSGADITFGLRITQGSSCSFSGGCFASTVFTGVDNYSVTLTGVSVATVPVPQPFAMLLAGLGLVGSIARRGKQDARNPRSLVKPSA
ncbi:MAG: PEP-CTERM sorting domain-containing protein [Pseudomonadota bacterium]